MQVQRRGMHKMNDRKYKLIITLKSDLCAGSGYSYAGIIDNDICYDAFGIPYIAARRLKGCLREAAELIGLSEEEICGLFGSGGADKVKGIYIDNAYIDHYEEVRSDIEKLGKDFRRYITPQSILEQFTTVKAQTRIGKGGAAEDNSLRYTRTVNHYSPLNTAEEMRFTAIVVLPGGMSEECEKAFRNTVTALRNIGMNRNRGLGSVRCILEDIPQDNTGMLPEIMENGTKCDRMSDDTAEYTLQYTVKNISPLVMSTSNDFKTEKYISGRSVLGFFAGAYLRTSGKSAEDDEFKELFLKNKVLFGGLYPAEERKNGIDIYYPAPAFINRLKKTKKYVNASEDVPRTEEECSKRGIPAEYACGYGNQPKRLKGKFVCMKDGGILVKEPATDIVYHHTKKSKRQGAVDGDLLYTTEVLREQQHFSGEITGRGDQIKVLAELLTENTLRFGKSKSAQYGTCVLTEEPKIIKKSGESRVYKKESRVLAVLESDAVFVNQMGYTVRCDEVREQIRDSLKIREDDREESFSEIESGVLTGYYSKWNLKRTALPVVKAGSTFEFVLADDLVTDSEVFWTGENNGEGFGRIRLVENDGSTCCINELKIEEKPMDKPKKASVLFRKIIIEEARERLMQKAVNTKLAFRNPASLGRVTLMLSESVGSNPNDPRAAYLEFVRRIQSIKTDDTKKKAEKILSDLIWEGNSPDSEALDAAGLKYFPLVEDLKEPYSCFIEKEHSEDAFETEMTALWSDYLMAVFVQEKYNLKHEEESHEED